MIDKFERIITLFNKAYIDTITPDERQELEVFLANPRLREVYDEWIGHELLKEGLVMEKRFPYQKAFAAFKRQTRGRWLHRRRFYAVAASVAVVLLAASLYWFRSPGGEEAGVPLAGAPVIVPGHSQARIRLASGELVTMSDQSLQVDEHGETRITYEEGKVTYNSAQSSDELIFNELIVPVGGECTITFDDGTRAWVNADTKITYPVKFTGKERKIHVEGEAYFEVQAGAKPFIVHTGLGEITALGTAFAVRAYHEEEMMTTLVSGRVAYAGHGAMELAPGEQIVVSPSGEVVKREVDVHEYIGWKEGMYVFNKRALESIMTDLSRWYEFTVSYKRPELKRVPFSGHLKRYDDIHAFLELLRETGEVDYIIQDRYILLY
jgi:ferric-dicitrate binding protein FerR (iron transport regulator)